MFHTDVHAVAEIVDKADSAVSKTDKAAKVVRAISAWQAFRQYDWLRSVPMMNSVGDLRGMVVSSDWRAVFTFTTKAGDYIDKAGTAVSVLSIMVSMAESYHDVDRILKSNQPPEMKAAQLSTQVTGIAMKYLTGIVTAPTHLFLTGLNSVGACDLVDRITKRQSGQCRQYVTAADIAIQSAAQTVSDGNKIFTFVNTTINPWVSKELGL